MCSSSSSSSCNWVYDVFPSFRGEDVRKAFLSHFLKELDRKLISAFKDKKIDTSESLDPVLKKAIKDSKIAIVIFSQNYASSSWCLNELLEIVKCQEEFSQIVIPVFYHVDPSHVRYQVKHFGEVFQKTCGRETEDKIKLWRKALTDVANLVGYHSQAWENEAIMIEVIANDVLVKLNLTPSNDFEDFVGIEDHIAKMSSLLELESEEVRMVGIWGPSGIGKTTIARALFNRLSRQFQGKIFIDMRFISKSIEDYSKGNPNDYNMKLHLQEKFLSKILDKQGVEVDHLGAVRERLKHQKVLIFIDDLDAQVVLDALAGGDEWFGSGSRVVAITKDKHILRGHGIEYIYEVGFPSKTLALKMLCQSAFKQDSPPDGFVELASEVVLRLGCLPLGLNIIGSSLRGRNKKYWVDLLPTFRTGLDGKIEKALSISYKGLERKEHKALFRHIACFFNGDEISNIKLMLADSKLNVDIGLEVLVDKSLIHVKPSQNNTNIVEMHCLVQEMGKEIVRGQSDEPGEREFIVDSKDICDVLEDNTGTKKVIGISLNIEEIDELNIHENAFKAMRNLRFLKIDRKKHTSGKEGRLQLPESFNYLPPTLKLLSWPEYPLRGMPSKFRPENLVKLVMRESNLEKLWEGIVFLSFLKEMDLGYCHKLKEIPNLSKATNLETLILAHCSSLMELPSSIRNLNKLTKLNMWNCLNLKTLPTGINLKSLDNLDLRDCKKLRTFPEISTNISVLLMYQTSVEEFPSNICLENLDMLWMENISNDQQWERMQPLTPFMSMLSSTLRELTLKSIPNLVELPSSSFQYLHKLKVLTCVDCRNLETLPTGINLKSLNEIDFSGCSRLRTFPDISTNISDLDLSETGIEEVPRWVEKFSRLKCLSMESCSKLEYINLNMYKLTHLERVGFKNCGALAGVDLSGFLSVVALALEADNIDTIPFDRLNKVNFDFSNCFNLDPEGLLHQRAVLFMCMRFSGEEVSSYFTHRTTRTSSCLTDIPLPHTALRQTFFRFRVCVVVTIDSDRHLNHIVDMHLECRFKSTIGNVLDSSRPKSHTFRINTILGGHLFIWDCWIHMDDNNHPLVNYVDMGLHMRTRVQTLIS